MIKIPTNDDYIEKYIDLCQQLKKKYGKPWAEYEKFEYPFKKADGHLELALKSNKAFFVTRWAHETNYLNITIDSALDVRLDYESWGFTTFVDFKEKSTQKDL